MSPTFSKESNAVFINVVNWHKDKAITSDIVNTSGEFTGKAEGILITAKDMQEAFVFDKQQEYAPVKTSIETKNNKLTYSFPTHSFTQIKIMLKRK